MRTRKWSEKRSYVDDDRPMKRSGYVSIVVLLHMLSWTALYVLSSTIYVAISTREVDETVLVPGVITAATASISIVYVVLHNAVTLLSRSARTEHKNKLRTRCRWLATMTLRLILTMWLVACGLSVTFTLARHSTCSLKPVASLLAIDIGTTCIVQRSIVGASVLALISSLMLFMFTHRLEEPFRAHLFGVAKEQALLPLVLPYKAKIQRQMFSEMSFKCRSSTSLSSHTLVPSCDSTTTLLPGKADKIVGLGIYAPKTSATWLAPRPSLSSIRTHTTLGSLPPPSSPLPPLPAYFPEKYRKGSTMHKAVYPPRRPPRPERSKSDRTVRIVPPSPALSIANLERHNSSVESLSSVYSRSISGEKHGPESVRPRIPTDGSRSYSSGSTATIVRSPLGAMRLADRPEVVMMSKSSRVSSGSSTEIDDVMTLQAKLPSVKAVSDFGDVQTWRMQNNALENEHFGSDLPSNEEPKQRTWMPLRIRRTRDSESLFQYNSIKAAA